MSTAPKLAQRLANPGSFPAEQAQRLAQDTARKVNSYADMLNALVNRSYVALATDTGNVAAAAYATLLTANITTVLATGYLIVTFSASGIQNTGSGTLFFQVLVDGVVRKGVYTTQEAGFSFNAAMVLRVPVTRGAHVVVLQGKTNNASYRINAATTNEEHASLLVQEAS